MLLGVIAVVVALSGLWWYGSGDSGQLLPATTDPQTVLEVAAGAKEKIESEASGTAAVLTSFVEEGGSSDLVRQWPGVGQLYPLMVGDTTLLASIATTTADRIKGLSGTVLLPHGVVKLFVFDTVGGQPIWMKDMQYAIDIIWLDESGVVIHYESHVSPDTYPTSFSSPRPAKYVIEARAGFVSDEGVLIGTATTLPTEAVAGL